MRKRKPGFGKMQKKNNTKEVEIKAVMFVPFTAGSKLVKDLRDAEEKLGGMTGYRLKLV